MVRKTKKKKGLVVEDSATNAEIKVPSETEAKKENELVMEAKLFKSDVTLMNNSQNYICLQDGKVSITLAPREIKVCPKDVLRELMKNPMVRRIFDKGVITHNADEGNDIVSAHSAEAPEHLKQAVERHEGGASIVAEVKKFERDGSVNIELG